MRQTFRITPAVPVQAMKTYQILAPKDSHWRKASCEEFGCKAYTNGWRSQIDETTDLGKRQAHYIRKQSGRKFTEESTSPGMTVFTFEAGQSCFGQHEVPIGRPEIFLVRDGDWRGNPTGQVRTHKRPEDWVEDFAIHQNRLADQA